MNFKSILFCAAVAASLGGAAQAANLVTNGSFDADTTATKIGFQGHVSGWTGGGGLTFLAPAGSADDTSQYLAIWGPYAATSPDGGNFILADGDPNYSGAFSQTISGLTVGKSYELNFYQGAGQQFGFNGPTTERWQVSFGNDTQLSTLVSLPSHGFSPWAAETMKFTATSVSQTLTFLAVGTPNGAPPISLLDGVSLNAVPEPSTWAMLVIGFGVVGVAGRRRRTATVSA